MVRPRFTYLGHSTVRCDLPDGKVFLINPWVRQNPVCPDECKHFDRIDAMLITNGHPNISGEAADLARQFVPDMIVGTSEFCYWLAGKSIENCYEMNIGGSQDVLGARVTQVQAIHTSSIPVPSYEMAGVELKVRDILSGDTPSGFVVRFESGYTIYHAGDTALFSDMKLIGELYHPDLAFLPIGGRFTMGPREAAMACKFLNIKQVIPIHWGTSPVLTGTPDQLERELGALNCDCEMIWLDPGDWY